jgi:hypothetical protein
VAEGNRHHPLQGPKVVCRLGPFHTLMSFLGSIGHVMQGSGLAEVLECCYGPNTVGMMMEGKAVKRALRGHFLVDSALNVIMLKKVLAPSTASPKRPNRVE